MRRAERAAQRIASAIFGLLVVARSSEVLATVSEADGRRPPPPPVPAAATGDAELIREIVQREAVVTEPPGPSLLERLWALVEGKIGWSFPSVDLPTLPVWLAQWLPIALLGIALAWIAWIWLSRLRPRGAPMMDDLEIISGVPVAASGSEAPARDWEREAHERLAAGRAAAALEAIWWWLACRLLPQRTVDPSWTSRELLVRAERLDLAAAVRRLDRQIYGEGEPAVDDVRAMWRSLREAGA
ncbi:MAG: hypothetical protein AAGN46_02745 [Acidobacteriota bacterium]